jgi:putative glycerol-1-phosphate prenyltransferase
LSGQSNNKVYNSIIHSYNSGKKQLAILIDPDKYDSDGIILITKECNKNKISLILIGGSLLSVNIDDYIKLIKKNTNIPVVIFPGSFYQVSPYADSILFLSLISGRNPDYLINNQVIAAPYIKKHKLEYIPTGYILIEGEKTSSVEYISNTKPIPSDKTDIIKATALAGEMLGQKLLYLEAGSGAKKSISADIVSEIKSTTNLPVIVGGGIKTPACVSQLINAGADIAVIGNAIEENPDLIAPLAEIVNKYNS